MRLYFTAAILVWNFEELVQSQIISKVLLNKS